MIRRAVLALGAFYWVLAHDAAADPLNRFGATAPAGYTVLGSGLGYRVLKRGQRYDERPPNESSIVRVRAWGRLLNGDEFWRADKPVVFSLNQVIQGWRQGLRLMRPGDRFSFWIPPELAYGAEGRLPAIPPYAHLVFEVELLDILEPAAQE